MCRDELTDAIRPSAGAAVVEIYYVAHLACCFMQRNLVLQAPARLARDRMNQYQMREALRDVLPTSFACLVLLGGLFARRRHADSHVALCRDGGGRFFLLDWPWPALESQSTRPHMQKRRRSLGRPLLHARALCDHGAPRRSPQKPRVVDRGHISTN
jgi:hypothetical protein